MCKYILTYWMLLSVVCVAFFSGCEQLFEQKVSPQQQVEKPSITARRSVPDYIAGALAATGGRDLWLDTKEIEYDCVVTFYEPDGSSYLTSQHHLIKPWSRSIRITATEPDGKLVCEFTPGKFKVLEGKVSSKGLAHGLCERELSEIMLEAVSGSASLQDVGTMFTRMDEAVRREGLWYYPIERVQPTRLPVTGEDEDDKGQLHGHYWSEVFYYQRADSSLVDMFWFAHFQKQKYIGVRCYDYKGIVKRAADLMERTGVFIPRKVEFFRTDSKGIFHEKIVEIDIKNCMYMAF